MTVAELRAILDDMPDTDQYGENREIWIGTPDGYSNIAACHDKLNLSVDGSYDLLLLTIVGTSKTNDRWRPA